MGWSSTSTGMESLPGILAVLTFVGPVGVGTTSAFLNGVGSEGRELQPASEMAMAAAARAPLRRRDGVERIVKESAVIMRRRSSSKLGRIAGYSSAAYCRLLRLALTAPSPRVRNSRRNLIARSGARSLKVLWTSL